MTTKEKARRYDEALERASKLRVQNPFDTVSQMMEYVFPELQESEDEVIRKRLINICQDAILYETLADYTTKGFEECLAWLKKQGNKPVDNVEPMFHEGDFIKHDKANIICQVISVNSGSYYVENIETGGKIELFNAEQNFHLWTIQDAKEGDVLWHSDSASNGIFIFKEIRHDGKVLCYCDYDSEDHFCTGEYHTCCWSNDKYIKPATKEQRDLLFAKMKEAGYEWDEDKKELRKIEHKITESEDEKIRKEIQSVIEQLDKDTTICGKKYDYNQWLSWFEKQEPKPKWSDEDDTILLELIRRMEALDHYWNRPTDEKIIDWLKSLKQRINK